VPSSGSVETVALVFEAFNGEDVERLLALTHEDFEVAVPAVCSVREGKVARVRVRPREEP